MDVRNEQKLIAKLRQHDPAKVRVIVGDDERAVIAVGKKRRRWVAVVEAVEAGPWSRLEFLTKDGDVLGYVDNDAEAGPLEDLGGADTRLSASVAARHADLTLLIRAQREVLSMRDKEITGILSSFASISTGVIKELTTALHVLQQMHAAQLDAAMQAAEHQAQMSQRDWVDQATELAAAAPQLAPVVQLLFAALGKKQPIADKPKAPSNGAPPGNGKPKA